MPMPSPISLSIILLLLLSITSSSATRSFPSPKPQSHDDVTIHIAMTLDSNYLRGTLAAVSSLLSHSSSPLHFHFLTPSSIPPFPLDSLFPSLVFSIHPFLPSPSLAALISSSSRPALQNPLNYARFYLPHLLPSPVSKIIYLDSDVITIDDISNLWSETLPISSPAVIAAPEYCHVNISRYFNRDISRVFSARRRSPCYFNTGVMVIDLLKWRNGDYTTKIERWMKVQKETRIYELGSLPPLLLAFAGDIDAVDHKWNQHGLGGDNVSGECREVHPGPVSLLHWSGKDKPWDRLDEGRPCPVDHLWKPYDVLSRVRAT